MSRPWRADHFRNGQKDRDDDQHYRDDPEILCARTLDEILKEQPDNVRSGSNR